MGEWKDVAEAYETYAMECERVGETVQPAKSKILMGKEVPPTEQESVRRDAATMNFKVEEGLVVAGIPVGSVDFVHNNLRAAFDTANETIERVSRAAVSFNKSAARITQKLYKVLRWCLAPAKVNHFLRNLPKAVLDPYISQYDDNIHALTLNIMGVKEQQLPTGSLEATRSKLICKLAAVDGGLGLTSAKDTADAQRAGNLALTASIVATVLDDVLDPEKQGEIALPELYTLYSKERVMGNKRLAERLSGLRERTEEELNAWLAARKARNATETEAPEDCDPKLLWTKDLPKAARNFNQASRFEALERVKSILSDQTCKAWFLSGGDEGAAWLLAGKGAMLTDAEFQALLRVRIMIPATDRTPYAGSCKHCANGQQGSLGLHVLHCQGANASSGGSTDGNWSRRHRDIKAAFNRSLAGIFKEEAFPAGALDLNEPRAADHWRFKEGVNTEIAGTLRADLLLKGRVKEGTEPTKYLLDFTTKHPNPFVDNQTALVAGTAARLAEEAKFKHYNKYFIIPVGGCVPIALETGGRFSDNTRKFIRKYLREEIIGLQKDEDWNPEDRVRYNTHLRELVESVSVALARSVASALLWNTDYRRACPLARRGGLGSPGEVRAAAPVGGGA